MSDGQWGANRSVIRFMKRLGCLVGQHAPARRAVQYEAKLKVGPCRYCSAPLEKHNDGRWRKRRRVHTMAQEIVKGSAPAED